MIHSKSQNAYELVREQFLPLDREAAFDFFRDPQNLERITPPWMGFQLEGEPPSGIKRGTRIDYRIRLFGIPLSWRTHITHWDPPHAFIDSQERGPYKSWEHLHTLQPMGDGVLMRDRVRYRVSLSPVSRPLHALFIRPTLERIFNHRYLAVRRLFGFELGPPKYPGQARPDRFPVTYGGSQTEHLSGL